jgi:hypothetical protein
MLAFRTDLVPENLGGKNDATGFLSPDLAGKLSATWSRRDKLERRIVK